jgi:hypothetical protein
VSPHALVEPEEAPDVEVSLDRDGELVERDAEVLGPEAVRDVMAWHDLMAERMKQFERLVATGT